jgi:hypothetical protein
MKPFKMTRTIAGSFYFFRVTGDAVGDYRILSTAENVSRADAANVVLMVRGVCSYKSSNPNIPIINVMPGDTSEGLPDFEIGTEFKVEALTDDTEFFCINRAGHAPFSFSKFVLDANEILSVPRESYVLLGSGELDIGSSPLIVEVATGDLTIKAVAPSFGLLVRPS